MLPHSVHGLLWIIIGIVIFQIMLKTRVNPKIVAAWLYVATTGFAFFQFYVEEGRIRPFIVSSVLLFPIIYAYAYFGIKIEHKHRSKNQGTTYDDD